MERLLTHRELARFICLILVTVSLSGCPVADEEDLNPEAEETASSENANSEGNSDEPSLVRSLGSTDLIQVGEIYEHNRVKFETIHPDTLNKDGDYHVYLRIQFNHNLLFSGRRLQLALNGIVGRHGTFFDLEPLSHWETENGAYWLWVDVSDLKFEDDSSVWEKILETQNLNGNARFWIRSPYGLKKVQLVFIDKNEDEKQVENPSVVLDSVNPSGALIRERQIAFRFHSPEGSNTFLCQFDEGRFLPCQSPKIYATLRAGNHQFKVKALDSNGESGEYISHTFDVVPTTNGVEITQVTPDANPTSSTEITFDFEMRLSFWAKILSVLFKHFWHPETYCRIDGGRYEQCQSPITYSELKDGEHQFEVQLNIFNYSEADSYSWVIDSKVPIIQWDKTPNELTGIDSHLRVSIDRGRIF